MNKLETKRIGFLGFDGVQALDIVGPADAFGSDAFASLDLGAGKEGSAPLMSEFQRSF
jgi:hypothetical protein